MSEENTSSQTDRAAKSSTAPQKSSAEILSSEELMRKRMQRAADQSSQKQLYFFPVPYRNAHMEILFAYQEYLDSEMKEQGVRRNVGWQRISREIIESVEGRKAGNDEVKSLKNSIEAHYYAKSTINEEAFDRIEKFIRRLDVQGDLVELRKKVGQGKNSYLRSAFAEMFSPHIEAESLEDTLGYVRNNAFLAMYEDGAGEHWCTVIRFGTESTDSVLDVEVFQIIGSFFDYAVEKKTSGVTCLKGFAIFQEITELELERPDQPGDQPTEGRSVCGTIMASQPFEKSIGGNGFTSAWFDFRVLKGIDARILNSELLLYSLPLPHHRIFFEMLCDTSDAVRYDPFSQNWEFEQRIGESAGHFETQYSQITSPSEMAYVALLSEKFDGAY